MVWIELVTVLALLQLLLFAALVSRARVKYGVKAPATTGNEMFERYYRVQMNTIELLIVFLPALWLAGKYWSPYFAALAGAIYLIGRMLYLNGYVKNPGSRNLGFSLSAIPIIALLVADLAGVIKVFVLTYS